MVDEKNHYNQFSLGSNGTKEGKEKDNKQNFHSDQMNITKSSPTGQSKSSSALQNKLHNTYSRQFSKLLVVETRLIF